MSGCLTPGVAPSWVPALLDEAPAAPDAAGLVVARPGAVAVTADGCEGHGDADRGWAAA